MSLAAFLPYELNLQRFDVVGQPGVTCFDPPPSVHMCGYEFSPGSDTSSKDKSGIPGDSPRSQKIPPASYSGSGIRKSGPGGPKRHIFARRVPRASSDMGDKSILSRHAPRVPKMGTRLPGYLTDCVPGKPPRMAVKRPSPTAPFSLFGSDLNLEFPSARVPPGNPYASGVSLKSQVSVLRALRMVRETLLTTLQKDCLQIGGRPHSRAYVQRLILGCQIMDKGSSSLLPGQDGDVEPPKVDEVIRLQSELLEQRRISIKRSISNALDSTFCSEDDDVKKMLDALLTGFLDTIVPPSPVTGDLLF